MKKNKNAGFFIRLFSLIIDVLLFSVIGITSTLMCVQQKIYTFNSGGIVNSFSLYQVGQTWTYYVWLIIVLILLIIQFVVIPLLFQGRTIGMMVCKLKLKNDQENKNFTKIIIERIGLGGLLWIIVVLSFLIFVNPHLINKMNLFTWVQNHKNLFNNWTNENKELLVKAYTLSNWEITLFAIPATMSPIIVFSQLLGLITVGINAEKRGLFDKLTSSTIVYKNKVIEIKENNPIFEKPFKREELKIFWRK